MDSDGRLSQDELRNSAIRTYSRKIVKTKEDAEISQLNIPLSKDLLERMKKHHAPFSSYLDVVNAVGEVESQEYAPVDMRERDAVNYANILWRQKPASVRDHIIHTFARRIRAEEKDLPEKEKRIQRFSDGRKALAAQRVELEAKPVEGNRPVDDKQILPKPAKTSFSDRLFGERSFLRKFKRT